MVDFRTYKTARREPAVAGKPVIDPAGWTPDEMRDISRWTYEMSPQDVDELRNAVAKARRNGIELGDVTPETVPLGKFGEVLEDIRRELADGRGAIRIRNFPLRDLDRDGLVLAYLALGAHIGTLEPQNKHGHVIGHVKDFQANRPVDEKRGYNSNLESTFHTDSCDYVGLLCIGEPKSGGNSLIASSVTIYNRLLAERPDLVDCLLQDFYKSRYGEERKGELPYYKSPVFAFVDGYFSASGYSPGMYETAQLMPGVPPFTEKQKEALPVISRINWECSIEMPFRLGDLQIINNHVLVHNRRGFEDAPGMHRHLLRLWLNDRNPRPLPEQRLDRRNRAASMPEVRLNAPVDLDEPVPV